MLISKKELLKTTGISYGQLYRWKRERLIPEKWFIKQPSFTGQETFFPKEKILNRIKTIQELKDKYSLEELAGMLSPEVAKRVFSIDDLDIIEEVDKEIIPIFVKSYAKESFEYIDLLSLIALSNFYKHIKFSAEQISSVLDSMKDFCLNIKSSEYTLILLERYGEYYIIYKQEQAEVYIDKRMNLIKQIHLNDISNHIKLKYRKSFNFKFDDESGQNQNTTNLQYSY